MSRHKILLQTNGPHKKTGLAENGRILMNWLAKRDKYDLVYYCTNTMDNEADLHRLPYKAYGAFPTNAGQHSAIHQQMQRDPNLQRHVMYGAYFIDGIVKEEKPTIWVGSDDIWSFPDQYYKSEWFKRINSVLHITVDSKPVSEMAYDQARNSKHYLTWAKFGAEEMKRHDPKLAHVDYIYGASDTTKFRPFSTKEKMDARRRLKLDPQDVIFIFLGRNQLRKEFLNVLMGFAQYKKEFPHSKAKLLFHTAWNDTGNGWDIPRIRDYYGVKKEDVLAPMVCKHCHNFEIKPYEGEDKDCPHCGEKKCVNSPNGITDGVLDDDMKVIYGVCDAAISAFTSGGLEFHNVNSLLSGLPLACTNYSCGEDFCEQPFVYPITWTVRHEVQSSFVKASNDPASIKAFIQKICQMKVSERQELGARGRAWAADTFSIDTIGAKWEKLFDAMPMPDWSSVTIEYKIKNPLFPMPQIQDNQQWIKSLYNNILMCEPDPDGLGNWLKQLEAGISRDQIYNYFIKIAIDDNAKSAKMDFGDLLDKANGKKRALFVLKESIGDLVAATSLFESFHQQYPDHDLYVATDPKYNEILDGNPFVKKVLPYMPFMEQELAVIGAGGTGGYFDVFFHPAILCQRQLGYLSITNAPKDIDL